MKTNEKAAYFMTAFSESEKKRSSNLIFFTLFFIIFTNYEVLS